jgi:hypothetical protein
MRAVIKQTLGLCRVTEGLVPAVRRIATILPNDLGPTNMNGPNQPLTTATMPHCSFRIAAIGASRRIFVGSIVD